MDLLDAWANWHPGTAPHIFDGDEDILRPCLRERDDRAVVHGSWQSAAQDPNFCRPGDTRLHLGLIPQPFDGDVRNASIYVLLLNPGLGADDYYAEYQVPEYRAALLATLKQQNRRPIPFLSLDPEFAWHGGWDWWHGKFAKLIERVTSARQIPFADARAELGRKLASIELLPYHSPSFRDAGDWLRKLRSVQLARSFVHDFVLPRVRSGEAVAIVTRQVNAWGLPKLEKGLIQYDKPGEARAAHLTPESRGGRAILEHLGVSVEG